jgi:hypothetical protein
VFENKSPAIVQSDFLRFSSGALVETVCIGIGWIPGMVEPGKIGLFVGDPFLDCLPRRLDGLHGVDTEWRPWKLDDAFSREADEPGEAWRKNVKD